MVPIVDIILVNWNTGPELNACLASIASTFIGTEGFRFDRVVVVDNASTDGSAELLDQITLPLQLIVNGENRGFAAACNQGAHSSKADYLLFLNPDTRLYEQSLQRPIEFMEMPENRKIGICGIRLEGGSGSFSTSCAHFPSADSFIKEIFGLDKLLPSWARPRLMSEAELMRSRAVDQIIGAFFLVRRRLYEELNGLDERFFVYFEEVDFSIRALERGYSSYYLADVSAYHRGGGSSSKVRGQRLFYSLASRLQYSAKHFPPGSQFAVIIGTLLVEPLTRLGHALIRMSWSDVSATIEGYYALYNQIIRGGGWRPDSKFR